MLVCLVLISILEMLDNQLDEETIVVITITLTLLPIPVAIAFVPWREDYTVYWTKLKQSSIGRRCLGSQDEVVVQLELSN